MYAGLYLVSAGTDQLLVLWDVGQRKAVDKRTTPSTVSAVSWHPTINSLACISEEGSVAVWDSIVPDGHPGPHVSPDSLLAQGVTSPQEGDGERGGSVDPAGRWLVLVFCVWMHCRTVHVCLLASELKICHRHLIHPLMGIPTAQFLLEMHVRGCLYAHPGLHPRPCVCQNTCMHTLQAATTYAQDDRTLLSNRLQCPDEGMDSFIDQDMENEMAEDTSAPGSAVKKRKGLKSKTLYASAGAQPQPPVQPGATLTGCHTPPPPPPPHLPTEKQGYTASLACMFALLKECTQALLWSKSQKIGSCSS